MMNTQSSDAQVSYAQGNVQTLLSKVNRLSTELAALTGKTEKIRSLFNSNMTGFTIIPQCVDAAPAVDETTIGLDHKRAYYILMDLDD